MKRTIACTLIALGSLVSTASASATPKNGCIVESANLACFENGNPTPTKLTISGRDLTTDQIIDKNERTITDLRERERELNKKNSDLEAGVARLTAENAEKGRKLSQLGSFFNEVQTVPEGRIATSGETATGTVNSKKQPVVLHKKADNDSTSVGKAKAGAKVEILNSVDDWYLVRTGGITGYLRKGLISVD